MKIGPTHMRDRIFTILLLLGLAAMGGACSNNKITEKKKDPHAEAARLNLQLGTDYFRQGNLQQAKEKIDRALDQDPRNATANATAGLLYDRLGEVDAAEKFFNRAVNLEPKNPDLHNNFAVFLCRHGKYERGEKQALAAASDPLYRSPEVAVFNAALCARGAGDLKRTEEYLRRSLALQPRFASALQEMADLEFNAKNYLAARGFMERCMAAQTPSAAALWLGIRIERALNNRAMAGDYARRLLADHPTSPETKQFQEGTGSGR